MRSWAKIASNSVCVSCSYTTRYSAGLVYSVVITNEVVSNIPQIYLEQLLKDMDNNPKLTIQFEDRCALSLMYSKAAMLKVDPEVLEVPPDFIKTPGMFGWFKVGPACNFAKAKINAIDGALFGAPGFVRMNLAFDANRIDEIVHRLNAAKGK